MKRWEYRNIHLLLLPVYLRMIGWCIKYRLTPMALLKADYALDHGGATFASKYDIQMAFAQDYFPPTRLLPLKDGQTANLKSMLDFGETFGFPLVAKPDVGRVGFGVTLIHNADDAERLVAGLRSDYLLQEYVPGPEEYGVFYARKNGKPQLFSINSKEFPSVVGDGEKTVAELIEADQRLTAFAHLFNHDGDNEVPADGVRLPLSAIGSHTLGCIFREATDLVTPALLDAIHEAVGVEGFHYGRLDVRTPSVEALQRGEFKVIEVNGVESLATNAFDPSYSYRDALVWFVDQYRLLFDIASEHRDAPVKHLSFWAFVKRIHQAEQIINEVGSMVHHSSATTDLELTKR